MFHIKTLDSIYEESVTLILKNLIEICSKLEVFKRLNRANLNNFL
jgi:hypothetical protein